MHTPLRRGLLAASVLGFLASLAIAADNFPLATFGGTRTVIDALDTSGVYTIRTLSTTAPSAAAGAGITPVVSATAESDRIVKASAGNLYGLTVTAGATAGYVLVFNSATAPANGAVTPLFCWVLPANSSLGVDFGVSPAVFSTGITASFSSTGCFTKTSSATAFFSGAAK